MAVVATSITGSSSALAQACCAGASAVTPGRLELHEDELVGVQLKAGSVIGSYQTSRQFLRYPAGVGEIDLEQDVFGAVRVLRRGQLALLVPVVETQLRAPTAGTAFGGGIGDINLSARYDFVLAGESQWVPGIALLGGVTFPTGKPPEQASQPVDATGIGAFQFNGALALEQTFGPWLVNATGIVAQRTTYQRETLATQVTLLAALAYTFPNDAGLAFSGSYVFEGAATSSQGGTQPLSAKSVTTFTLAGLWPITDVWRVIGSVYVNPPIDSFGSNQLADAGLSAGVIRSWM